MIYPQKISSKKSELIINILLSVSITIVITLVIINKLKTPRIPWAALVNCGIIYTWITVIYSIKKGTNIAGYVLNQTILASIAMLYIDNTIGYYGWCISIGIPIALIVANITMIILTMISYKRYIKYAIYQLVIVLLSFSQIIFVIKNIVEMKILIRISIEISAFSFIISTILCYKDIKEAIVRKFHM